VKLHLLPLIRGYSITCQPASLTKLYFDLDGLQLLVQNNSAVQSHARRSNGRSNEGKVNIYQEEPTYSSL
jgi:hypothetical protein